MEHLWEIEALQIIMAIRSSGTFMGSCGFYCIKKTRCRGKFRRIWIFNILGLVTNKLVHIRTSMWTMFFSLQVVESMFYVRVDFYGYMYVCMFYFHNTLCIDEIWYRRSAVITVMGLSYWPSSVQLTTFIKWNLLSKILFERCETLIFKCSYSRQLATFWSFLAV